MLIEVPEKVAKKIVVKRDGKKVEFDGAKIALAIQTLQSAPGRQNSYYRQKQFPLVHCLYGNHHLWSHRCPHPSRF